MKALGQTLFSAAALAVLPAPPGRALDIDGRKADYAFHGHLAKPL